MGKNFQKKDMDHLIEEMQNTLPALEVADLNTALAAHGLDRRDFIEVSFDDYKTNSETYTCTFIEFAILNNFFFHCYQNPYTFKTLDYGYTNGNSNLCFGGSFDATESWWFRCKMDEDDNEYIFHTRLLFDNDKTLITQLHVTVKKPQNVDFFDKLQKQIFKEAFNHSEYSGKCIKVKLKESHFKGIEVIDIEESKTQLILNDVQKKYIEHFMNRVKRGSSARYLLNGEPGTGKTQSIRDIIRSLTPKVTFIIPDFNTSDDLNVILEACEIFENAVIIMDDIDLFLGNRENGGYSKLLGEFLGFFDGVKKRKISLLASTNDKNLVDKAAERPGRFNMTLDFTFLNKEQIKQVCEIHLPEKYHVDEVYEALSSSINGKKANITGAFIANLAENIREMSEDDENWTLDDTLSLIKESYMGFYSSQNKSNDKGMGFNVN